MATRKGSRRVTVYNEGLLVFLYDEASVGSLGAAADALHDFRSLYEWQSEPRLRRLADKNRVVVYELDQDGGLDIEVLVGPPLQKRELAHARWHPPQATRLSLTSGNLFIDSVNSFRPGVPWIEPGSDHAPDPGATIAVPPGEYVLTVHRLFTEQMRTEGIATKSHPSEVVVLSPSGKARPVAPAPLFLPVPDTKLTLPRRGGR
jgi:hypothetical protein